MSDPASRRQTLGALLALAAAVSFACNTALASVAYGDGATALSVLTYRTTLAATALYLILKLLRVPVALPPGKRWIALGSGVLLGAYSYGLLGAIQHMHVALAVLTFYLWPLILGVGSALLGVERLTWGLALSLVVGFAGLVLALDAGSGDLSARGVALAASGAVIYVILVLINRRLVGAGQDSRPVSVHMLSVGALTYALASLVQGEFPLPQTAGGWTAFFSVGLFYSFSIISAFIVLSMIGPLRAGIYANLEPVSSVVIGTTLLHQAMKPSQLLGAALVLGAIVFTAWNKGRRAAPA